MVIPYWIIKSTYTNCEDVLFNPFFLKDNYWHVSECYFVITLIASFGFYQFVVRCASVCITLRYLKSCLTILIIYVLKNTET